MEQFTVSSKKHTDVIEITREVNKKLSGLELNSGVNIWVPHTTAAVTVNESADPSVMSDLVDQLAEVIPWENNYNHREGNSAAHIKSVLTDCHQWVPVVNDELKLGRWQGIFFLEWDGPRTRKIQLFPD